jgi:hypothetical protein
MKAVDGTDRGSGGSLKKLDLDDRFFLSSSQKAVTSDATNIHPDLSDDDLSRAMGTETLLAHVLVQEGLPAFSKGPTEQQIHHIRGVRYLVVDQSANRRHNSKVSKIWQDGMELRA